MARIPFIEQQMGGPGVADLVTARPNQAFNQLAQQADRSAGILDELAEREAAIGGAKALADFRLARVERITKLRTEAQTPEGHSDLIGTDFDEAAQKLLQAHENPRVQAYLEQRLIDARTNEVADAVVWEAETRSRVVRDNLAETGGKYVNMVARDPRSLGSALADVDAMLEASNLSAVEISGLRTKMHAALHDSAIDGLIRSSPGEIKRQLMAGKWDDKGVDVGAKLRAVNAEIDRREAEARAAQAAQAQVAVAGLEVKINQFANGQLETLDQSEIDNMKGQLTPSAWSSVQRAFDDARARRAQADGERVNVAAMIQMGERIDPGNSKQKKAYDEFFRSSVIPQIQQAVADLPEGQRESAFTGRLLAFIKSQGVVPETVQANVRTALRSGSPQQKAQAAATIDQIKVVSPRALLDIDDDVLRQANAIASYVDYGADPEQAARMAEEAMRQGETERKALGEEYDRIIKENPTTAWLEDMQGGWLSTVKVPLPVAVEIDAGVRREFLRNGGNLEAARRTAVDLTKKRYGETTVNGVRELTRNPIEQHYELPWMSKEQIAKAAKVEAIADMKSGGAVDGELTEDRVRIRPYPVKGVVAADGRPAYAVEVQDSTGAWTVQMDLNEKSPTFGLPMPWAPSFAREKAEREARIKSAIDAAKAERLPLSERITLPGDRLKAVR